jgi:hypothetical protein
LKRLDMSRLPASERRKPHARRWKRYEKPLPGHQVQIDVTYIEPIKGSRRRYYQLTALAVCTGLRILRIVKRLNQKSAIQFCRLHHRGAPSPAQYLGTPGRFVDESPSWGKKAFQCHISKTAYHGIWSTIRPTGIAEGGSGVAGPPQGCWSHRLPRRTRPDGVHPASGGRQVHPGGGGSVHWQATRCRIHREHPSRCSEVAAVCPGADDA